MCVDGNSAADVDMGNKKSGTPLLQMMMYAIIQRKPERIQYDVVNKFFIAKNAVLSRVLCTPGFSNTSVLEMSICLTRFDIAEKLVFDHNIDPIKGGDPIIKPVFVEYANFGTNRFVKAVLKRYDEMGKIHAFIGCLWEPEVFSDELRHTVTTVFGRNATHTILLSGHEEAIDCLVGMEAGVLEESDDFNRTALHLAAEQGDKESMEILLKQ